MSDSQAMTPAQKAIGDFAPKLVSLTDDVLFGDVWERTELSKRDRSLITVAGLIKNGSTELLRGHLARQGQRSERGRAEGGHHPPRVLRRLAPADVRRHCCEGDLRRLTAAVLQHLRFRSSVPLGPRRRRTLYVRAASGLE
jgi:Carboxymuconolactone decarboxylase family